MAAYPENLSDFDKGERQALLQLRSFIATQALQLKGKRLVDEIDGYCAQRLHDIRRDAEQEPANGKS